MEYWLIVDAVMIVVGLVIGVLIARYVTLDQSEHE